MKENNGSHCTDVSSQFVGKYSFLQSLFETILVSSSEDLCNVIAGVCRDINIGNTISKASSTVILRDVKNCMHSFFDTARILCEIDRYNNSELFEACRLHGININVYKGERLRKELTVHLFTTPCMLRNNDTCVQPEDIAEISDHQIILMTELVRRNIRKKPLKRFIDSIGINVNCNGSVRQIRKEIERLISKQQKGKAAVIDRKRKALQRQGLANLDIDLTSSWPPQISEESKERCFNEFCTRTSTRELQHKTCAVCGERKRTNQIWFGSD